MRAATRPGVAPTGGEPVAEISELSTDRNPVDDFLVRWEHVRGMTREFLEQASDALLDFVPAPGFVSVRVQSAHLAEVQGVYQEVFSTGAVDMSHKAQYTPAGTGKDEILAALGHRDADLGVHLDQLRPQAASWKVEWYGNRLGIAGFGAVFIQHEALHHGQWALHAHLNGSSVPIGWLLNWGL
jgi:DinB superfamily